MLKLLLFIKRKDGLSREAFIEHYETAHAPLIARHFGRFMSGYERNYLDPVGPFGLADAGPPSDQARGDAAIDVITEIRLRDRAAAEAMFAAAADPQVAAEIAADEATFVDRAAVRMQLAEVYPRP